MYHIYPKYSDTSTPYHICSKIWTSTIHYPMLCLKIAEWVANSVDPDEMPRSAASHLGLYCLLRPVCPNTYGKYGIQNFRTFPIVYYCCLTFPLSGLIQQTTNVWYFSYFSKKTRFDILCKLSHLETFCMKCQNYFLGKIKKKYFKMSSVEIFIQSAKRQYIYV